VNKLVNQHHAARAERRGRCRGTSLAECPEQIGVEFGKGSNEEGTENMSRRFGRTKRTRRRGGNVRRRFGRTKSAKRAGRAYGGKTVGLGISVVLALIVISFAVLLLRRRAGEETTPVTPEPEAGVEAVLEEEMAPPGTPSAEDVPPREEPPPGEERPESRGGAPTSPPTPREEPPPGEERPGRR
jgi:hypothetical protein